jgi:tripeptide aminopeptidase
MDINRVRLIKQFSELVAIDSPSFGEKAMGTYIKRQLTDLGFIISEDQAGDQYLQGCGNIYGFLSGDKALGPPLLLCAHMDTVEPARGKRAVISETGLITSDGTTVLGADDVSGLVAIFEALRVLRESGLPHRPIEVLFTVAEEIYCCGASQFNFSKIQAKEAYVLDLTGPIGSAAFSAPSILFFTATVSGQSAHAGFEPEKGVHAIAAAAHAVSALPLGHVDEDTTLNIGVIGGGRATNIVPDECEVRGEVRSFSHDKALNQIEAVKKQFINSAQAIGASVSFEVSQGCHAYRTPPDSPVVRRFAQACETLGIPVSLDKTFGGSDNNYLAANGISGLVIASGMQQCHTCQEYTTVDDLVQSAGLTLSLILADDGGSV